MQGGSGPGPAISIPGWHDLMRVRGFFCAILAMLVFSGSGRAAADQQGAPDARVTKVLRGIQVLSKTPVWPGFQIDRPILLVVDGKKSFLLGAARAPQDYRAIRYGSATVYERTGPVDGIQSDFVYHFDLGGLSVFALRVSSGEGIATEVETLFHEYFHDFQEGYFAAAPLEDHYELESAENQILASLEQLALAAALRAGDQHTRDRLARMFVAIRRARDGIIGAGLQAVEDGQERIEGTADYVGKSVRWQVTGTQDDDARAELADTLRKPPALDDMAKSRSYATGHAQGWLLDFAGVPGWKEQVAEGATLYGLMAKTYPVDEAARAGLIESAKSELMGYQAVLDNERDVLAARQKTQTALLEQFETSPGVKVHVGSIQGTSNVSIESAAGHSTLSDGRTLYAEIGVLTCQHEGETLKFRVENRMLIEGQGYTFRVPDELSIVVDGVAARLRPGTVKFHRLELRSQGFSLSAAIAGELTFAENALALTWEPPAEPK